MTSSPRPGRSGARAPVSSRCSRRQRPGVEPLEGRALLTTLETSAGVAGLASVGSQSDHNVLYPGSDLESSSEFQTLAYVNWTDKPGFRYTLGGQAVSKAQYSLQYNETSHATTLDLKVQAVAQSFRPLLSNGQDGPPAEAESETGATTGGNPGGWVDLVIAPSDGEKEGDPVRVELKAGAAATTTNAGVGVSGEFQVDLGDGADPLLYRLNVSGANQSYYPAAVTRTFDTAVGRTIRVWMSVGAKGVLANPSLIQSTGSGGFTLNLTVTPLTKPDYVAGAFGIDPKLDAVDYSYELAVADAPAGVSPKVTLFWAKGPNLSDTLTTAYETAAVTKAGKVGPKRLDFSQLAARPDAATHLLLVLDSNNAVNEQSETNNLAALKVPRTDLSPLTLAGDLKSGFDFSYAVSGFPVPANKGSEISLYWASAPSLNFVLGGPLVTQSVQKAIGSYGTFHVPSSALGVTPAGAKMLILVVDPSDKILEESETNNVLSLNASWVAGGGGGGVSTAGPLAWGAKVSQEFRDKVRAMAGRLGITDPSWLMAAMAFETGGSFSPKVENRASKAVGLIQFLPKTAKGLGTSAAALKKMTAEQQLDWVEKYLSRYQNRMTSVDDVYMAILLPSAVGQPADSVLFYKPKRRSPKSAYAQNAYLDANRDGKVTKAEAAKPVRDRLISGGLSGNVEPTLP